MVCKGPDLNLKEREWCPSESSGESEVVLDAGVDLAEAVGLVENWRRHTTNVTCGKPRYCISL